MVVYTKLLVRRLAMIHSRGFAGRTKFRDIRKKKPASSLAVTEEGNDYNAPTTTQNKYSPLPIHPPNSEPHHHEPQSFGAQMGTYFLLGTGVTMGFAAVRILLG